MYSAGKRALVHTHTHVFYYEYIFRRHFISTWLTHIFQPVTILDFYNYSLREIESGVYFWIVLILVT